MKKEHTSWYSYLSIFTFGFIKPFNKQQKQDTTEALKNTIVSDKLVIDTPPIAVLSDKDLENIYRSSYEQLLKLMPPKQQELAPTEQCLEITLVDDEEAGKTTLQ